jgi:hypothetical protein
MLSNRQLKPAPRGRRALTVGRPARAGQSRAFRPRPISWLPADRCTAFRPIDAPVSGELPPPPRDTGFRSDVGHPFSVARRRKTSIKVFTRQLSSVFAPKSPELKYQSAYEARCELKLSISWFLVWSEK